jgi:HD-like signal output (HDOD) protein
MVDPLRTHPEPVALLDALRKHPQLPGLGSAVARLVAMADGNDESIQQLRDVILADVHLTQRIIGIANSVGYRLPTTAAITTVTRAIVVIGFDQIKLIALGMMFVDEMPDRERATALKAELIQALQASLLAKEMARLLAPADLEKAAIAALLGNVAKLLLVMVDFDGYRRISIRIASGVTEALAAHEVLGISLKTLAKEVLAMWGIPDSLVALSTTTMTATESKSAQPLFRIVAMAKTTAQHLRLADSADREAQVADVRARCTAYSAVSGGAFDRWVVAAEAQMAPVRASLEQVICTTDAAADSLLQGETRRSAGQRAGRFDAVGKPANSQALILAGLEDLKQLIVRRQSLKAILLAALECMHTGFGYSRSILLLRDAGTMRFRARMWCGAISKTQANALEIDVDSTGDMFAAAIRRGSDLQIQNILDPAIAKHLPRYFAVACPHTTSFSLLPVVSDDSPIACILVGRDVAEPQPITPEDIRLLRAMRAQIAMAMKSIR